MSEVIAGKGGGIFKSASTSSVVPDATALGDIVSWECNIAGDTFDSTHFSKTTARTNAKEFVAGTYGWNVTANGLMANEVAIVTVGTSYRLIMREADITSTTTSKYQFLTGIGICNNNTEGMEVNGQATRNFTFQGTGVVGATYSTTSTFR